MTIEIGGFIGLAALIVGLFAWLRQDINRFETRMNTRLSEVEARMDTRLSDIETRISEVETTMSTQSSELRERMAKLEGLLEGLRESITGRRAA